MTCVNAVPVSITGCVAGTLSTRVCAVCVRALWSGRSGDDTDDASGAVHVMGEKEKISAVSTRYGVSVADLMRWNGVLDRLAFYPGQVVRLTAPKALATAEEKAEVKR